MNEIKQIRIIQFAASLLLQLDRNLKVYQANSSLYDIIIETPGDKAICLARVIDDDFLASEGFAAYMHELRSQSAIAEIDGNPLCLIKLDEVDLSLDFQIIGWRDFEGYKIEESINFQRLIAENVDYLINEIRKLNHTIRILDMDNVKVIKHIRLEVDSFGHRVPAEIVYLRDFTDGYKMAQIEPETEEEEREKRETGHFQRQYPSDILDEAIIDAVKNIYPQAGGFNSLLVTNMDYRKLLEIQMHSKHEEAEIRIIPDFENLPLEVIARMGRIKGLRFRLDIYIQPSPESHLYDNEGFELRLPMNNWIDTLNRYTEVLKTMHRVKDLV